jgi:hypothetical protein
MRSVTIKPQQKLVSRKKRKSSCGAQDFLRHKTASSFVMATTADDDQKLVDLMLSPPNTTCLKKERALIK